LHFEQYLLKIIRIKTMTIPTTISKRLFVVLTFMLASINHASANVSSANDAFQLIAASCPDKPYENPELISLKSEIIKASTLAEAKSLALAPTDDALNALRNAKNMIPFSSDLVSAEARLNNARSKIILASSQEQVADEFDGMLLAGLDNDRAAHVSIGSGGCDYSSGELIAIVVGLILGIIPGIILLVVLC
jgi:hypothetical protein